MYNINYGDELVIQKLDDNKFRIIPEKLFQNELEKNIVLFENSENEIEVEDNLKRLSEISNTSKEEILRNEFVRLSKNEIFQRKIKIVEKAKTKESIPLSLRKILLNLYHGKCQISGFSFLMKNGCPYFEIHHIDPQKGNHFKNLLVVSPNVHAQFTYANLEQIFDSEGWLRYVKFNNDNYSVFQIIDKLPKFFEKQVHFNY
jgi:hypothetical protein